MVYTGCERTSERASKGCFPEWIAAHSAWPVHPYSLNSNSDLYSSHVRALSHPGEYPGCTDCFRRARLAYAIDRVYKVDVPRYNIRTSLFLGRVLSYPFRVFVRKETRVFAPEGRPCTKRDASKREIVSRKLRSRVFLHLALSFILTISCARLDLSGIAVRDLLMSQKKGSPWSFVIACIAHDRGMIYLFIKIFFKEDKMYKLQYYEFDECLKSGFAATNFFFFFFI